MAPSSTPACSRVRRATRRSTGIGNGNGTPKGAIVPDGETPNSDVLQKALTEREAIQTAKAVEAQNLGEVEKKIADAAALAGLSGSLELRLQDDGLVVTLLTDKVLFESSSAELAPDPNQLLSVVGTVLKTVDNATIINGYTDSRPIATTQFPSNWELSGARATSVARYFETLGIDRARLSPTGRADMDPVGDNATEAGRARNRRVEIIVKSKVVDAGTRCGGAHLQGSGVAQARRTRRRLRT